MKLDYREDLLDVCEVLVLHANGVQERLNILSVEVVPRFTERALTRILVAPPLTFADDGDVK